MCKVVYKWNGPFVHEPDISLERALTAQERCLSPRTPTAQVTETSPRWSVIASK